MSFYGWTLTKEVLTLFAVDPDNPIHQLLMESFENVLTHILYLMYLIIYEVLKKHCYCKYCNMNMLTFFLFRPPLQLYRAVYSLLCHGGNVCPIMVADTISDDVDDS